MPAGVVVAGDSVWVTNSGDATVQRFSIKSYGEGPIMDFNVGEHPTGIVYAEDAIWVACSGDDVVWRIDPSSAAIVQIPVGDGPSAVSGGLGSVWVANAAAGTVSRIDPRTNTVVATVDVVNAPAGIAAADGFLWVTVQAP